MSSIPFAFHILWKSPYFDFQLKDLFILAGISPRDFDTKWDTKTLIHVKKWLEHDNHQYCQGNILLSIMDTLWVDSIDIMEMLQLINEEIKLVSVKRNLLDGKFGVKDSKAIELMKSLAEKAG